MHLRFTTWQVESSFFCCCPVTDSFSYLVRCHEMLRSTGAFHGYSVTHNPRIFYISVLI